MLREFFYMYVFQYIGIIRGIAHKERNGLAENWMILIRNCSIPIFTITMPMQHIYMPALLQSRRATSA